ncbi:hypothetical protein FRC11_014671 [Ceratobasidium sp. 423]|nr:hypothetical protein FRC11_014671 [Ceratobasidium sp. 423]
MARCIRYAGQSQPSSVAQPVAGPASPFQTVEQAPNRAEETTNATNNFGIHLTPPLSPGIDMDEGHSNDAAGQPTQSTEQFNHLAGRFNQVLERLTQLVEKVCQPADKHDQLAERFNQLFERFNQIIEESDQPAQRANQLAERSHQLIDWSNQLIEQLTETVHQSNQLLSQASQQIQRSSQVAGRPNQPMGGFNQSLQYSNELAAKANQLAEQANTHSERLGDVMKNINKVLVGIQHAIVRNGKGNTLQALDCLVNETGGKPGFRGLKTPQCPTVKHLIKTQGEAAGDRVPVVISGVSRDLYIQGHWLGDLLRFFDINEGLHQNKASTTPAEREKAERERLSEYLSSCLDHPGWYPAGQVCYPPSLPTYLKNVYDLKPIVGVPSDDEVMGIHAIMQAANRASGIPGMHDSRLFMGLADHLFGAQMAHIPIVLEPVSGAPSDEEITKAQDAIRAYQQFSLAPSMFDVHVNMELSQHLFNIQMARYIRCAGENQPSPVPLPREIARPASPVQAVEPTPNKTEETTTTGNNAGTGENNLGAHLTSPLAPSRDTHEAERPTQPTDQLNPLAERFNQVLERLTQLLEKVHEPADKPDQLAERFGQLFDRFDQVLERSNQSAERANQLIEQSNRLVEQLGKPAQQSNQLAERFNQLFEQSNGFLSQLIEPLKQSNQLAERLNQLIGGLNDPLQQSNELAKNANQFAEQANKSGEKLGDTMKTINKVLVRIQHAIVRNHKGNTLEALDCLVNEAGEMPGFWGGSPQCYFLRFFGIGDGLCKDDKTLTSYLDILILLIIAMNLHYQFKLISHEFVLLKRLI